MTMICDTTRTDSDSVDIVGVWWICVIDWIRDADSGSLKHFTDEMFYLAIFLIYYCMHYTIHIHGFHDTDENNWF